MRLKVFFLQGKARGNRLALYSRSLIQKALFALGSFVERHAFLVIAVVLAFFTFCCYGLQFVRIETDIVKLWVASMFSFLLHILFHSSIAECAQTYSNFHLNTY